MTYNNLFDTKLLPKTSYTISGKRDKMMKDVIEQPISITHYDQFITNGYEYIVLSLQSLLAGGIKILQEQGFTVINVPEMAGVYGFRKSCLQDTYNNTHDIVMCVMVNERNDNKQINNFFKYYFAHGVEKIFMFYCGKLANMPIYPQHPNVSYLEWDFNPFWVYDPITNERLHYLQLPLYCSFFKKISPKCNWTIFCDLDEYLYSTEHKSIKGFLKKQKNSFFCTHKLCSINFDNNEIITEKGAEWSERGKSVMKGEHIEPEHNVRVHKFKTAKYQSSENNNDKLLLLHNRHWPVKINELKNNIIPSINLKLKM